MITNLLAALALFLATHAIPALPGVRQSLVHRIGRKSYLAAYILLSLISFTWVILAALSAPSWQVWEPGAWHFGLALGLMLLACITLMLGVTAANPLSLTVRRYKTGLPLASPLTLTRHPLLWALVFWSLAHLISNADTTGLLMFGTLGLFAAVYMPILDKRNRARMGTAAWLEMAQTAPLMVFGGQNRPVVDRQMLVSIGLGVLLFVILLLAHEPVIGISPLWIFRS